MYDEKVVSIPVIIGKSLECADFLLTNHQLLGHRCLYPIECFEDFAMP